MLALNDLIIDNTVFVKKSFPILDAFDDLSDDDFIQNVYDKLAVAEEDVRAGRVSDVDDALNEIRAKYGLHS